MKLAPDASPDDGLFDVVLIGDMTKLDFVTTAPKLYKGSHVDAPADRGRAQRPGHRRSAGPLPIEVDGEPIGTTPVRFEVVPDALRVHVAS